MPPSDPIDSFGQLSVAQQRQTGWSPHLPAKWWGVAGYRLRAEQRRRGLL